MKVGVVAGQKASDAALLESIEAAFPDLKIVRYQIPFHAWVPWVMKRIRRMGIGVLIGHLFLSTFLRIERLLERISGTSLWLTYRPSAPSFQRIHTQTIFALSEDALIDHLRDVDVVILLDSFRLSHRFYRRLAAPCLQIVWGEVPEYMGDSGAFWAYALGEMDRVGSTIIRRTSQLNRFQLLKYVPIACNETDDLRSIKMKQVVSLEAILPGLIRSFSSAPAAVVTDEQCRFFVAPTFWTYQTFLRQRKLRGLPGYAYAMRQDTMGRFPAV